MASPERRMGDRFFCYLIRRPSFYHSGPARGAGRETAGTSPARPGTSEDKAMDETPGGKSFDELKQLIEEARTAQREEAIGDLLAKFLDSIRRFARAGITYQRAKFDSLD